MTIKQLGGVFGRNPTFNDVTIEGELTFDGDVDINSDLKINGELEVSRTGDGSIVTLKKGTTEVGSIKTIYNRIYIGHDDAFLMFANDIDAIYPALSAGVANNGNISLGTNTARYNDLFLAGDVVLASGSGIDFSATSGTGTSELFDDYEEGTFTAAISTGSGSATLKSTHQTGRYTKVGRLVHVCGYLQVDTVSTPGGFGTITGLPFTVANNNASYVGGGLWINGFLSFTGAPSYLVYTNTTDFSMRRITGGSASDDMGAYLQANSSIMFNITYTTEA